MKKDGGTDRKDGKIYVLKRTRREREKILWEEEGGEILIWRGKRAYD